MKTENNKPSYTGLRISKENLDFLQKWRFSKKESADKVLTRIIKHLNLEDMKKDMLNEVEKKFID